MRRTLMGGTALRLMLAGLVAVGSIAVGSAGAAQAQGMGVDAKAKARAEAPEQKPVNQQPVFTRVGSFVFQPKMVVGATYDDNIYVDPTDEEGDVIFNLAPRLDVKSNFARHGISAFIYGDGHIFASSGNDSFFDYGVGTEGVIDVARVWKLIGGVSYKSITERRGRDDDDANQIDEPKEPVDHQNIEVYLTSATRFARGKFTGTLSYLSEDYNDASRESGDKLEQDDRDRTTISADARLTLDLFELYSPFLEVQIQDIDYDKGDFEITMAGPPIVGGFSGPERDGERYRILAGFDVDLTGVLFGSVALGYGSRNFDNSLLSSIDGVEWDLGLTWLPTQLTALDLNVSRNVGETTINGASGFTTTDVLVALSHDLTRDLTLGAHGGYGYRDYEGTARSDDTFRAGLGATYDFNRHFDLNARYEFWDRDSDDDRFDYSRNLLSVTFTAKL